MKRKDSILANFYYQALPKAKEGGNYFNKYKVPQNTTPVKRIDPILKFYGGGDYKDLPGVTIYSNSSKKKKEILPSVKTSNKESSSKSFVPSVSSDFFRNKKTITPEQQFNAYSNFADNNAGYDMSAPVAKTNIPSAYSEQQFRDMPLINTGRKALNSQAQAAALMQLMKMSDGIANNHDAYINMLEQTDPERAALLRFMNPNAFKQQQFFNGGFLMPAKQGGILAYPNNNNQSGYVAPRMDAGGFNTTTQTTIPNFGLGPMLINNPIINGVRNAVGNAIGYFMGGNDNKTQTTTPKQAEQISAYNQMNTLYDNAYSNFMQSHPNMNNVPYSGKTIKLTKGRLTGADIDTGLLDYIKKIGAANKIDPYRLAALVSRESTFGVGTGANRAGSSQALVSGWNVDQDYVPYELNRFLADKKVPGINSRVDGRGWHFWLDDENKVNDYLKAHPNLLAQYQKKLASIKPLDKNASYFDLASQWINKPGGIRKYNPGAPGYESLYNQDLKLLQSDPVFSKYFGSKEMGGDISIPDLNTSNWLTKYDDGGSTPCPSGYIKNAFGVCVNASGQTPEQANAFKSTVTNVVNPPKVTNNPISTPFKTRSQEVKEATDRAHRENFHIGEFSNQATISQGQASTPDSERIRAEKLKQYDDTHPYAKRNALGDIERTQYDRSMEGVADPYTTAAGIDKGMDHMNTAMEIAGYITGAGELTQLGIKALKNKTLSVADQMILEGAQNLTSGSSRGLFGKISDKIYPIRYRNQIAKLESQLGKSIETLNTPEGRKRLSDLGINPDELFTNTPSITSNPAKNSAYNPETNTINVNMRDAKRIGATPQQIIEHEQGHNIQAASRASGQNSMTVIDENAQLIDLKEPQTLSDLEAMNHLQQEQYIGAKLEGMPYLREMRQDMIEQGIIKNQYDPIDPTIVENYLNSNSGQRFKKIIDPTQTNYKIIPLLLNRLPVVAGAVATTAAISKQKYGGWIDKYANGGGVTKYKTGGEKCPKGYINIDGECIDITSEEYIDMLDQGRVGTMVDGKFWGNKATMQPVVIYSSKDKDTQNFFNKIKKDDPDTYESLIELQKRYGHPHVSLKDKPGFFDPKSPNDSDKMRAHYSAKNKRLYLADGDNSYKLKKDYLAELSHHKQVIDKGITDFYLRGLVGLDRTAGNMILNFESPNNAYAREYDTPGSLEYQAHEEIQPKLEDEYNKIESDKLSEYYYNNYPGTFPKPTQTYQNGGGLLSRTVRCSNCGHSWKGVTGGMDPLTCHNCGGMIKMEQGGMIQYGPGGQTTDGCPAGYNKHPLTGECMPNGTALSQVIANSNKQKPSEYIRPNNVTDVMGRTPAQTLIDNQIGQEIHNRNVATNKRQFINQGQATTKESEARRKMLTQQAVAGLPNVQMDQFGNTSAVNPNMTYTGEPANFMGERQQKSLDHIVGALEAAGYVTGAGELVGAGYNALKPIIAESMESGLLSKAHTINPWAFKPQEGMMYRGLGQEGMEDAIQSGVFRPKQLGYAPNRSLAEKVATPKQFENTFYAPAEEFGAVKGYGPNYLAEVPFEGNQFGRRYGRKNWSWSTPKQIPIDEGRILKKDWLQGYKKVPTLDKKKNGGDISIPDLQEGNWLSQYDDGGQSVNDCPEGQIKVNGICVDPPPSLGESSEYNTETQPVYKTLPTVSVMAKKVAPKHRSFLSYINPLNWGVHDYSNNSTFQKAYRKAKDAGEKNFMYGSNRYSTKYAGTPAQEMEQYGITNDQRIFNPSQLRLNLGNLRTEGGYNTELSDVFYTAMTGKNRSDWDSDQLGKAENDAFNLYLGLPQKHNSFRPSNYKPGTYEIINYNQEFPKILNQKIEDDIKNFGRPEKESTFQNHQKGRIRSVKPWGDIVMGKHTVKRGKDDKGDYIEYIDKWDLDSYKLKTDQGYVPVGGLADIFNKPFPIYGRVYYKKDSKGRLVRSDLNSDNVYENEENIEEQKFGGLIKAENGTEVKCGPGQVNIDGKCVNITSQEYKDAYAKGIGSYQKFDKVLNKWTTTTQDDPDARFVTNKSTLPTVTVQSKLTEDQKRALLRKDMLETSLSNQNQTFIGPATQQPWYQRAFDIATHPGTAIRAYNKKGYIPNNLEAVADNMGGSSSIINTLSPFTWAKGAYNATKQFGSAPIQTTKDVIQGTGNLGYNILNQNLGFNLQKGLTFNQKGANPFGDAGTNARALEFVKNFGEAAPLLEFAPYLGAVRSGVVNSMKSNIIPKLKLYGNDLIETSKAAGRFKLPTYKNAYRWQADVIPEWLQQSGTALTPEQQALTASWYTHQPNQLGFYMRTRPGAGNVNTVRLSENQIANLENNMSGAAKGMSGKTESIATADKHLYGELNLSPEARANAKQIRFDVNPTEYITPYGKYSEGSLYDRAFLEDQANQIVGPILDAQQQPILGIPRKYFPFKEGGITSNNAQYKNGGESWLSKYGPGGSTIDSPAPTPQTGSNSTSGPTFSNQAGQNNNNDQTNTDWMIGALGLAATIGGYGLFGNKKKKMIQPRQQPSNQQLNVDGNGKPIMPNQEGIAWNYNPNIEAQEIQSPTAAPSYGPNSGVSAANPANGMAMYGGLLNKKRRGGDVSIYGRRNYKADTPSFFNFGGATNNRMNINNWLNKYKS